MITAALLLRLEVGISLAAAVLLLAIPNTSLRIAGLPATNPFWPRLLGGTFLGLVLAALATDQGWTKSGLGLGGFAALNLTLAFVLATLLFAGPAQTTKRAKVILWLITAALAVLGFTEIAFAA
jgi:hypothetical protein